MLRRALGSVKDQASIGIAIAGGSCAPDLDIALVKATSHEEVPINERYVQELLHLTSYSRGYVAACVTSLSKRLSKTHNWVVAIKALILTHRLLTDGDPAFEHELQFGRASRGSRGSSSMRVLNLSNFRDDSHSHAWDYSAFVRTYALFLDEKLDFNLAVGKSGSNKGGSPIRRRNSYDEHGRNNGYGDRNGDNHGYGDGNGDKYGYGDRNGDKYGYGDRNGDKYGYGDRNGDKYGYGDRNGDKYGYGDRNGDKYGYGDRNGDKYGYGDRNGDKYGYGDRSGGYNSGYDDKYRETDGDYDGRRRSRENGDGDEEEMKKKKASSSSSSSSSMKDMTILELMERIPLIQRLLDRILACRPTGYARMNRLVQIALHPVVTESFRLYSDISHGLARLSDSFFDMDHAGCVKAFEIYAKGAKQIDELVSFYGACNSIGVCRSSEYPVVTKISEESIESMESFLMDRSEALRRNQKKRSSEPAPKSPGQAESEPNEPNENASYEEIHGMKALPAPPLREEEEPVIEARNGVNNEPDLLGLDNGDEVSAEERGDKLALALFAENTPSNQAPQTSNNQGVAWEGDKDRPLAGWELALVESESMLSNPMHTTTRSLAGGFDNLLLTSMYDQAAMNRKVSASMMPSGSASSVALPGRPASSSFLALPAPPAMVGESLGGEDPFAASLGVPPPSYVQMSDMKQKQQLLVHEQQVWYQYQADGMQGYNGLMKFYSPGYTNAFQPLPYYGASYH